MNELIKVFQHIRVSPLAVGIGLLVFFCLLHLGHIPFANSFIQRIDALTYDLRLRLSTESALNRVPPIVIVDIDEASLQEEGQWPWSRRKLARLVEILNKSGAAVIAFDVTFAEPEENPVDTILANIPSEQSTLQPHLTGLRDALDADQIFANMIKDKGIIFGYLFHHDAHFEKGVIKPSNLLWDETIDSLPNGLIMRGYTANLEKLTHNAAHNGFFNVFPDDDGVIRRSPLILEFSGKLYTSLALETVRHYLGAETEPLNIKTQRVGNVDVITHILLAGKSIRTDAVGQINVPFLGKAGLFPSLSASTVLHGKITTDLTDAIVLIGTSAKGLADIRTTPFQPAYPGVEVQATLIHGLLNPEILPFTPEWSDGAIITEMLLLSLLMLWIYPSLKPSQLIFIGTILLLSVVLFNIWLWEKWHIAITLFSPVLLVSTTSSFFILHRLLKEHSTRQYIHDVFGQYVPREHIKRLLENRIALNTDGERHEMTVLFSDIRSFTAISEHLTTQQLKRFLNHYLTPITAIIFDHQGTIDKYVGDLVMAFWGAPLSDPAHAEHAVLAALAMQTKIQAMQDEFKTLGLKQTVAAGIGINTGEMNVGDMGSEYRRAYTVLGDAVNLGSRLESLTKYYGVGILVSEDTVLQCPTLAFRLIDFVRVKGRNEAVRIYEPVALRQQLTPATNEHLVKHQQALDSYRNGQWKIAQQQLITLAAENASHAQLYHLYLQRIATHAGQVPDDWDGSFTHHSK